MKYKIALKLLGGLTVVVFNLVYFFVWDNMSATRWICWGAIHASFVLFVTAAYSAKLTNGGLIHAYPRMWVAFSLLEVVAIAGLIMSAWNPESWKVPVIILALLGFLYLFTYISLIPAEKATESCVLRDSKQKFFILSCTERLEETRRAQADLVLRKQIEKACDAIHCAQVNTVPAVAEIESRITSLVSELCNAAKGGSANEVAEKASEIVAAVRKRDMAIRQSR